MKPTRDECPLAASVKSYSLYSCETFAETLKQRLSRSTRLLGLIIKKFKIVSVVVLTKALARQKDWVFPADRENDWWWSRPTCAGFFIPIEDGDDR